MRKSVFDDDDGATEACACHDTFPKRLRLRADKRITLLTDTLGLELKLLCWPVGLRCGLVDKHSDSAEADARMPRVSFIVGDARINFENLRYRTCG